jgi:predicted small lipoprotein YifL
MAHRRGKARQPAGAVARTRLFASDCYSASAGRFLKNFERLFRYLHPSRFPRRRTPVTFRPSLLLACLALLFASGLAGCGRKGPLELPPETQAYGEALKKQKLESQGANGGGQTSTATSTQTISPPNESNQKFDPNSEKQPKKSDIPGTSGNRPPQEYPFPLDPIL